MDRAVAMHGGAAVAAGGQNRTKTKKLPLVGRALMIVTYVC